MPRWKSTESFLESPGSYQPPFKSTLYMTSNTIDSLACFWPLYKLNLYVLCLNYIYLYFLCVEFIHSFVYRYSLLISLAVLYSIVWLLYSLYCIFNVHWKVSSSWLLQVVIIKILACWFWWTYSHICIGYMPRSKIGGS